MMFGIPTIASYVAAGVTAVLLIAIGVLAWQGHSLRGDVATLTAANKVEQSATDTATLRAGALAQTVKENEKAFEVYRADIAAKEVELAAMRADKAKRDAYYANIIGRIKNAPQTDDGPLARVILDALDGLRQPAEAAGSPASAAGEAGPDGHPR